MWFGGRGDCRTIRAIFVWQKDFSVYKGLLWIEEWRQNKNTVPSILALVYGLLYYKRKFNDLKALGLWGCFTFLSANLSLCDWVRRVPGTFRPQEFDSRNPARTLSHRWQGPVCSVSYFLIGCCSFKETEAAFRPTSETNTMRTHAGSVQRPLNLITEPSSSDYVWCEHSVRTFRGLQGWRIFTGWLVSLFYFRSGHFRSKPAATFITKALKLTHNREGVSGDTRLLSRGMTNKSTQFGLS